MAPSGTCSKAGTPWTEQYNKVRRIHTEYRALPHGGERISVIGMGSSVIGGGNRQQLRQVLGFLDAPAEQRDYSAISGFAPADAMGKCVYCKHCHPCPAGLDVALINKYYDLARLGDGLAREHYLTLKKRAGDCVGCGHCHGRCPVHVAQSSRMQEILAYFGA